MVVSDGMSAGSITRHEVRGTVDKSTIEPGKRVLLKGCRCTSFTIAQQVYLLYTPVPKPQAVADVTYTYRGTITFELEDGGAAFVPREGAYGLPRFIVP